MIRVTLCAMLVALCSEASAQLATLPNKTSTDREIYRTMVRRLKGTRMSVKWEDIELQDAIKQISNNVRINMVIATPLRERAEDPISMNLKDVTAMTLLRLLRESASMEFQHRHGVLVATTKEDALTKAMTLGIYGIRLILYVPPDFPAPVRLGLRPGPPPEPIEEEGEAKEGMDPDFLVDLIRNTTGGSNVWDVEGASILAHKGNLFVRHAPHIQARVRRFLNRLR